MMLEGWFPIESQVGLFKVIASNYTKLAKVNFGGITVLYQSNGLANQS